VDVCKVGHAVLKVAHVAEEVLGHFSSRLDRSWWSQRWACEREFGMYTWLRWWWVSNQIGGHHHEKEGACNGENGEEVWVEADEGEHGQEGNRVGRCPPCQESFETILKDKYDSNSAVKGQCQSC